MPGVKPNSANRRPRGLMPAPRAVAHALRVHQQRQSQRASSVFGRMPRRRAPLPSPPALGRLLRGQRPQEPVRRVLAPAVVRVPVARARGRKLRALSAVRAPKFRAGHAVAFSAVRNRPENRRRKSAGSAPRKQHWKPRLNLLNRFHTKAFLVRLQRLNLKGWAYALHRWARSQRSLNGGDL